MVWPNPISQYPSLTIFFFCNSSVLTIHPRNSPALPAFVPLLFQSLHLTHPHCLPTDLQDPPLMHIKTHLSPHQHFLSQYFTYPIPAGDRVIDECLHLPPVDYGLQGTTAQASCILASPYSPTHTCAHMHTVGTWFIFITCCFIRRSHSAEPYIVGQGHTREVQGEGPGS